MDNLTVPDLELYGLPAFDDELLPYVEADSIPAVLSPALKPSQTLYSEKISIRIPHAILGAFRAQAVASGMSYQTLINQILAEHVGEA